MLLSGRFTVDSLPPIDQLDRFIGYLRLVHFYCYYCGEEFDDEEETSRKCGLKHLRGKKNHDGDTMNGSYTFYFFKCMIVITDTWASALDQRIKQRLENPDNPDNLSGGMKE